MLDLTPTPDSRPKLSLDRETDTRREIKEELDREHQELVAALQKELGLT